MFAFCGFPFVLSFFSVFLKLRDVQPLLILLADFQIYLLICLTHLTLIVFSSFLVSKSSHLFLSFIFSCVCHTHVTAELQNYFLICSSSLLLLIRFMIYVRFSRFLRLFHRFFQCSLNFVMYNPYSF